MSRDLYVGILRFIGLTLIATAIGVPVIAATGNDVPVAMWAAGGGAAGVLLGILLPRPTPRKGLSEVERLPDADRESKSPQSQKEPRAEDTATEQAGADPGPTPDTASAPFELGPLSWPLRALILVAVIGLLVSGLLYLGLIHAAGCSGAGSSQPSVCDSRLLTWADVLVLVAAVAGGTILGLFIPKPEPPATAARTEADQIVAPKPPDPVDGHSGKSTGGHHPEQPPDDKTPPIGWPFALAWAAIIVAGGVIAILLSQLLRATAQGAETLHWVSLGFIALTVAAGIGAITRGPEKRQPWLLATATGALLALVGNTASGFFVDRLTKHATPTDCVAYSVELDQLVDDESIAVAQQAIGKSDPRFKICNPDLRSLKQR